MDKKAIEEIMANDALLERLMEILVDEINNDDITGIIPSRFAV